MDVARGFPVSEGSKEIGRKCAEGLGPFYDVTFVSVSQILALASPPTQTGGCVAAYGLATVILGDREERMYRIWSWAMIDREHDGRFIASIPDLGDLAAYGENEKDAVAHVAVLAADHERGVVESGQPAPPRSP